MLQGAVGTLADTLRRLSTSVDALRNELDTAFVRPLASLDAPLEELKSLRRAYDRRLALYDQARVRCLQVASDARPAAVAAAEGELTQKKADFDAAVAALAAGLQAAHTARRCTPGEAACGAMDAHARFTASGERLCAPLMQQAEHLRAELAAERVAGAQHVASPSKPPLTGPRHRRTLSAGWGGEEGGDPQGLDDGGPASQRSMAGGDILKQGYLLKLSSSLYGDWKRRYFVVTAGGELHYFRDAQASKGVLDRLKAARPGLGGGSSGGGGGGSANGAGAAGPPPVTLSLLTTTVKASAEAPLHTLRFCFRVVSPVRTLTLQAENAKEQKEWMEAISGAIAEALSTHSPGEGPRTLSPPPSLRAMQTHRRTPSGGPGSSSSGAIVEELYRCEGNAACADCGADWPEWASLNLTVLLCLRCSGVHRSLGVHVSKVRSLTLDVRAWDGPMLQCFAAGGNAHVNAVLEAQPGVLAARPGPGAPHEAVREFASAKYVERRWVSPHLQDTAVVQSQLAAAVASGDVAGALTALLAGACADEMYSPGVEEGDSPLAPDGPLRRVSTKSGRTLLHVAASAGQVALCELLLHWRAAVDAADGDGRTPLYLACRAAASDTARAPGGAAVAVRLLQRGADPGRADRKGRSPAQLAATCRDEALQAALAQAAAARQEGLPGGLARTHSSSGEAATSKKAGGGMHFGMTTM